MDMAMRQTTVVQVEQSEVGIVDINEEQFLEMMKTALPDLYQVNALMLRSGVPAEMLLDFMGYINRVKESGWGTVQVQIQDGQIKIMEGKITKLYAVERYHRNA